MGRPRFLAHRSRGPRCTPGRSGRTVIVSSHLLSEIESICTYLVIIRFGVLMYTGPMADLLTRAESHIVIEPEFDKDAPALQRALTETGWNVSTDDEGRLQVSTPPSEAAQINRAATAAGFTLARLAVRQDSLESIFLEMTGSDEKLSASRAAALTPATHIGDQKA